VLLAGYAVRGTKRVICKREEVVLGASYTVRGTRYAVSDIYKRGNFLSSWILAIINKREICVSSWLRGRRYAVSDLCKRRGCLRRKLS